jgi:hypothetical protein
MAIIQLGDELRALVEIKPAETSALLRYFRALPAPASILIMGPRFVRAQNSANCLAAGLSNRQKLEFRARSV